MVWTHNWLKVLWNWLKCGMDPQAALDAPRLCIEPASAADSMQSSAAAQRTGLVVHLEEGMPAHTARRLSQLGHKVKSPVCGHERKLFGRGQFILVRWERDAEGGAGAEAAAREEQGGEHARRKAKRARTGEPAAAAAEADEERGWRKVIWAGSDPRGDGLAVGW